MRQTPDLAVLARWRRPVRSVLRGTKEQSATFKTILVRSGTYNLTLGTKLTSADNGETWTYYGPDGVDNAILDYTGMALVSPSTSNSLTRDQHTDSDRLLDQQRLWQR